MKLNFRKYPAAVRNSELNFKKFINLFLICLAFCVISKSPFNPSGLPLNTIARLINRFYALPAKIVGSNFNNIPSSSVYHLLRQQILDKKHKDNQLLLFIVLESLGPQVNDKALTTRLRSLMLSELTKSISSRDDLKVYQLEDDYAFIGTLGAELRYLCHVRSEISYQQLVLAALSTPPYKPPSQCIPELANKHSYRTHYVHQGQANFYNRRSLMALLGWKFRHFQPPVIGLANRLYVCSSRPFCGDDRVSYRTAEQIINSKPTTRSPLFIQILTIDTHAPYTGSEDPIFAYQQQMKQSIQLLRMFISRAVAKRQDIAIVVASDHPAPLPISNYHSSNHDPLGNSLPRNIAYFISK
jgi:hypothetical protein